MDYMTAALAEVLNRWQPQEGIKYRFKLRKARPEFYVVIQAKHLFADATLRIDSPRSQVHPALDELQRMLLDADADERVRLKLRKASRAFEISLTEQP